MHLRSRTLTRFGYFPSEPRHAADHLSGLVTPLRRSAATSSGPGGQTKQGAISSATAARKPFFAKCPEFFLQSREQC
jgi:hypothetical protein